MDIVTAIVLITVLIDLASAIVRLITDIRKYRQVDAVDASE